MSLPKVPTNASEYEEFGPWSIYNDAIDQIEAALSDGGGGGSRLDQVSAPQADTTWTMDGHKLNIAVAAGDLLEPVMALGDQDGSQQAVFQFVATDAFVTQLGWSLFVRANESDSAAGGFGGLWANATGNHPSGTLASITGARIEVAPSTSAPTTKATALYVTASGNNNVATALAIEIPDVSGAAANYAIKTGLGKVQFGDDLILASQPPAHSNSTGVAGTIAWDTGYFYVCTATDTWKRVALDATSW
jgi:hypothetical protein